MNDPGNARLVTDDQEDASASEGVGQGSIPLKPNIQFELMAHGFSQHSF